MLSGVWTEMALETPPLSNLTGEPERADCVAAWAI
jgi:hypothetical protein